MNKRIKNSFRKCRGISTLVLVFIIASLLAMVIFVLQPISLLAARRATQIHYSQVTFFAAEGALYETIQRLRDHPDWPDFPSCPENSDGQKEYQDQYEIGESEIKSLIKRKLTKLNGEIEIDIIATAKERKRRVVATFIRSTEEPIPLDIILVIDRSGSMEIGLEPNRPIDHAKVAAYKFVEVIEKIIDEEGGDHRIGLVSYATEATEDSELVEVGDYDNLKTIIENLIVSSRRTNIGEAVYAATSELDENTTEEAVKVILLLSDGVANEASIPCSGCGTYPCSETCCTADAIDQANTAKDEPTGNPRSYIIFSVLLNNINLSVEVDDGCTVSETEQLGRSTLQAIASGPNFYYETTEPEDLEAIYAEIAKKIISPGFFKFQEELPGPD